MSDRNNLVRFPLIEPAKCGQCGSNNVASIFEEETFVYGSGDDAVEISVRVPVHSCRECAFVFTDDAADQIRHDAICRHQKVMTPSEVAAIRKMYDVSRAEFARITRIGEASVNRWENGLLIQNRAMDQYLYLLRFRENFQRIREREQLGEDLPDDAQFELGTGRRRFVEINSPAYNSLRDRARTFAL